MQRKYATYVHSQPTALAKLCAAILEDRKGRVANHTQAWQARTDAQTPIPSQHFQTLLKLVASSAFDAHLQAVHYLNQAILDENQSRRTSMHSKSSSIHSLLSTPSRPGSQINMAVTPSPLGAQFNPPSTPGDKTDTNDEPVSVGSSVIAQRGDLGTPLSLAYAHSPGSNTSMTSNESFSSVDSDFTSKMHM
jgi:hypothetical protein